MACRQVPGLQPAGSKQKKQTVLNGWKHTRPNPLEQILAQQARHVNVIVDQHPDQDHQEELPWVIPLQQVHPAPKPRSRPVQPTQLQSQAPCSVQETQISHHQTVPEQQSWLRNELWWSRWGRWMTRQDQWKWWWAQDVLYSKSKAEAEDWACCHKAEKEEAARQSKKGKAKAHSTLICHPSLVTMTNIPATSHDTRASSSWKHVGPFSYFDDLHCGTQRVGKIHL